MAIGAERPWIMIDFVLVASYAGFTLRHLPLVWGMARGAIGIGVGSYRVCSFLLLSLMAGLTGGGWLLCFVRLMTLSALELHRRVAGPVNFLLSLRLVAFQTIRALRAKRTVLAQEVVAIQAVSLGHRRDLDVLVAVAHEADFLGWRKPVQCNRVTLQTTYALLLRVNFVPSRIRYLLPLAVAALVAFLALFIRNERVFGHRIRLAHRVFDYLFKALDRARLVTAMAVDLRMLAGCPLAPGFFHRMARSAEAWVILCVAVNAVGPVGAKSNEQQHDEHDGKGDSSWQAE